jgi:putative addiction module CopG family antidote
MLYAPMALEKAMNLDLPVEANDFVKGLVAQGKYQSEEEAVVDGIRLLMGREKLRGEIQVGIDQLERGESCDEQTVFTEVNAAIDEVEASQQGN